MEGFPGEKTVTFRVATVPIIDSGYGYEPPDVMGFEQLVDSDGIRLADKPYSEQLIGGSGRRQIAPQQPRGQELVSLIDSFYRQANISNSTNSGVIVDGNISNTPSIQGMILANTYSNPGLLAPTQSVFNSTTSNLSRGQILGHVDAPIAPISYSYVVPEISAIPVAPVVPIISNQDGIRQLSRQELAELRAKQFENLLRK